MCRHARGKGHLAVLGFDEPYSVKNNTTITSMVARECVRPLETYHGRATTKYVRYLLVSGLPVSGFFSRQLLWTSKYQGGQTKNYYCHTSYKPMQLPAPSRHILRVASCNWLVQGWSNEACWLKGEWLIEEDGHARSTILTQTLRLRYYDISPPPQRRRRQLV